MMDNKIALWLSFGLVLFVAFLDGNVGLMLLSGGVWALVFVMHRLSGDSGA